MRQSVGVKLGFWQLGPKSMGLKQPGLGRAGQGRAGQGKIAREHPGWVRGDWVGGRGISHQPVIWAHHKTREPGVGTAGRERERETEEWMGGLIMLPLFSSSLEWHHSGISAISQPLAETCFIHKAWTAASTQNDATIQAEQATRPNK